MNQRVIGRHLDPVESTRLDNIFFCPDIYRLSYFESLEKKGPKTRPLDGTIHSVVWYEWSAQQAKSTGWDSSSIEVRAGGETLLALSEDQATDFRHVAVFLEICQARAKHGKWNSGPPSPGFQTTCACHVETVR